MVAKQRNSDRLLMPTSSAICVVVVGRSLVRRTTASGLDDLLSHCLPRLLPVTLCAVHGRSLSSTSHWARRANLTVTDRLAHHVFMTAASHRAGNDLIRDTRRDVPAAIALLAAVAVFLVAETVAAAAWDNPAYSYSSDWVSDLGVPGPGTMFKGHPIHSPLALVLNLGFIVNGALVVLAGVLLLRPRGQGRTPRWQLRLLIGYGLGMIIAANFHEAPAWMFPFMPSAQR